MKNVDKKTGITSYGVDSFIMPISELYCEISEKKGEKIADLFEFMANMKDVDYLVDKYSDVNVDRGDRIFIIIVRKNDKLTSYGEIVTRQKGVKIKS